MNAKITIVELAGLMAEATSTTKRVCELFVRELFATVSQSLISGESVKVKGIGTFKVVDVKPHKNVSVSTGKTTETSGYRKVTFTPDKALAAAVNQPFAQFETVFLDDAVTEEKLAEIDKLHPSMAEEVAADPEEMVVEQVTLEQDAASSQEEQDAPFAPLPEDLPQMQEAAPAPELDKLIDSEQTAVTILDEGAEKPLKVVSDEELTDNRETETSINKQVALSVETTGTPASTEQEPPAEHVEPQEAPAAPKKSRPMLVGIPIDGPSQPVPEPETVFEPDPNDHFYRPEPRNAYTPTPEQLAAVPRHRDKRWLWGLLAVAVAGLMIWLFTHGGSSSSDTQVEPVVAEADTVVTEPEVITDTVTAKIVLTTLSERYYDSPWFWVYIYEENKSLINNPNNIKPGTVVVIPPAEKYGIDATDPSSLKKAQIRSMEILKRW